MLYSIVKAFASIKLMKSPSDMLTIAIKENENDIHLDNGFIVKKMQIIHDVHFSKLRGLYRIRKETRNKRLHYLLIRQEELKSALLLIQCIEKEAFHLGTESIIRANSHMVTDKFIKTFKATKSKREYPLSFIKRLGIYVANVISISVCTPVNLINLKMLNPRIISRKQTCYITAIDLVNQKHYINSLLEMNNKLIEKLNIREI